MSWTIIDTGIHSAEWIMQKDRELLDNLSLTKNRILHLYEWEKKSATFGVFLDPKDFFNLQEVEKQGLDLAKRPTGGGIIFHLWDLAFSVLIPASHPTFSQNTLQNYATVNRPVLAAAEEFLKKKGCNLTEEDGKILGNGCKHFCMAKPTRYDVMLHGQKIAGAAQRKTRDGLLHQGSISLSLPSKDFLSAVLLPHLEVIESMFTFTFPLLGANISEQELASGRHQIKELLIKHITQENAND